VLTVRTRRQARSPSVCCCVGVVPARLEKLPSADRWGPRRRRQPPRPTAPSLASGPRKASRKT